VVLERSKKRKQTLTKPDPQIVPTELPVFSELERLGLVVPVSAAKRKKPRPKPGRR
jgi:hypothetical protein